MQDSTRTVIAMIGLLALACVAGLPAEASAQGLMTNNTEVRWGRFSPDTQLIMATVKEPGRGPDVRRLKKDRPATFQLDLEGAKREKTVVVIDGEEGSIDLIPEQATVRIHWKPAGRNSYQMHASRIVYLSEEKLAQRKEAAE